MPERQLWPMSRNRTYGNSQSKTVLLVSDLDRGRLFGCGRLEPVAIFRQQTLGPTTAFRDLMAGTRSNRPLANSTVVGRDGMERQAAIGMQPKSFSQGPSSRLSQALAFLGVAKD